MTAARISVKVTCRASRPGVAGLAGTTWRVRLASAPVDGAANAELVEILSRVLGVPRRQIQIVKGQTNPGKVVQVEGLDADKVRRLLEATMAGQSREGDAE